MLTKGALGNLVNRYRAVLRKCHLINVFGSLAVASMLVMGGAGVAGATEYKEGATIPSSNTYTGDSFISYSNYATDAGVFSKDNLTLTNAFFDGNKLEKKGHAWGGAIRVNTQLTITGGEFSNNGATSTSSGNHSGWGGAIYTTAATEITKCDFTGNTVQNTKSGYQSSGGAIYSKNGDITITECNFESNHAYTKGKGGAILVQDVKGSNNMTINGGKFKYNTSTWYGGAIEISKSDVIINGTIFDNNSSGNGGAIDSNGGTLTITGAMFLNNHSVGGGYGGGAICAQTNKSTITIDGGTFDGNTSSSNGGAIAIAEMTNDNYKHHKIEFTGATTTFSNNSAEGEGGAIYNPVENFIDIKTDLELKNNTDATGKNDIKNNGDMTITDATVTLDGGISSSTDEKTGEFLGTITGTGNAVIVFTSPDTKVEAGKTSGVKAIASGEYNDILGGNMEPFKRQLEASNGLEFAGMEPGWVSPQVNADGSKEKNPIMDAALKQASITTFALDRILTNDVRKRLGDIRSDANKTGVWMRWDGGKLKSDGLTNNFNTIQIGGDTKVAKNCRLGVSGSFTHGDGDFAQGNGELEGFSFAAYATWMGENGMFADVVARLGHFSTEVNVEDRSGDMNNRVASLSGEYGWRFNVCDQFFVEPQVELAYTYVSSKDLELGDAGYHFDDMDSLIGRAGLVVGWNLPDERGNVYARASVVQQFMGDTKVTGAVTGGKPVIQEIDGNDTWLEYGIGANIKLTDKTYIWADVERTEGAEIDEEWRGTVGIRYSF